MGVNMEQQPIISPYPISEFLNWDASGQLVISPKFQRRRVWKPQAQSFLIDSIIKKMPIPPVYIRYIVDPVRGRTTREVVDGQQRIGTIFDFIKGKITIAKAHNREYAGKIYSELPEDLQKEFLSYKLNVNMLEGVSDEEVLRIFARLNTYTVPLNKQELRNAQFFGEFKQTVYELAYRHYAFWAKNNILTDTEISRMADAQLVSELLLTMLQGIKQTNDRQLSKLYDQYDNEFDGSAEYTARFDKTIDIIGEIFGNQLPHTAFKRIPLFFSLFIFVYDAMHGLLGQHNPRLRFTKSERDKIYEALSSLSKHIQSKEPPTKYVALQEASRRGTANPDRRATRHRFIWDSVRQVVQ
jgi:hypothetical protein